MRVLRHCDVDRGSCTAQCAFTPGCGSLYSGTHGQRCWPACLNCLAPLLAPQYVVAALLAHSGFVPLGCQKLGAARCPKARMRSGRGALGERVTLAHELLQNFRALQDPVGHDMRYTTALQVQAAPAWPNL